MSGPDPLGDGISAAAQRVTKESKAADQIPAENSPDSVKDHDAPAEGPDAAMQHLQQVHRPVLLAYVTRLTGGDVHWAEDVVQETMVRAWRNPDARKDDGRWSRGWLCTVARRIVIDHVRAVQARPAETSNEHTPEIATGRDDIERMIDGREIRDAIAALPERLRSALVEVYYEEHSVAEAAQVLDVPEGTVKSRTFHALRALRGALTTRGFFGETRD
ncbi:sigma-70 family RNA polymerase sigma factor [Actinoplanes sp. NPDC048988]|uniref:sigma-70 family RNA polymerase sigma factor n=1 Tax=Actinoplanes sp. NPDC048988 TaxID=3363901 RepID=UPI0037165856